MKKVNFGMAWSEYGRQTIPLPDDIDTHDEDAVWDYIRENWDNIPLPSGDYLMESDDLDIDGGFEIIEADDENNGETNALSTSDAITLVWHEREEQKKQWDKQQNTPFSWISILGEEYGKLCLAVNETHLDKARFPELGGTENIIREAKHVAAVAVAIMEAFSNPVIERA